MRILTTLLVLLALSNLNLIAKRAAGCKKFLGRRSLGALKKFKQNVAAKRDFE